MLPVSNMTIRRRGTEGRLPRHTMIGGLAFWKLSEVIAAIDPPTSQKADSKSEGGVA
jgi:predicted DNA-binding transcriptional regulator AlpA